MGKIKQKRVAEQIRVILSEIILLHVNDPRVQGITITAVDVDRELQHADVMVNALGDEERAEEVLTGLQSAQSFLRRSLGDRLRLRKLPQLHFHWDYTLEQALQVESLLNNLVIPPESEEIGDDRENKVDD
ncbi:MAG: 30S ribosome-binding factor RbfA [Chloroflexota bacterium]